MSTLSDLLADLNDRLNDESNQQVPKPSKVRYLNHGIRAMWPRVYRTARDSSLTIADGTWEYAIPAAVGTNSRILAVEVEHEADSGRFYPSQNYHIVPGLSDPILVFEDPTLPGEVGSHIRITAAVQLTELVGDTDTYDGPPGTEELPVLYAFGLAMSRRLDDRVDHRRFPSVTGANGVTPDTIMTASQFAFAQFELLLERFTMPLPVETAGG